jgi:hypothetical protein
MLSLQLRSARDSEITVVGASQPVRTPQLIIITDR